MSLKRLQGWEPATVFEYDDTGRLSGSQPETEWDPEQRGWVLALAEYRASRCPLGCGHNVNDTTGMEVPGRWKVKRVRCHACAAELAAQQAAPSKPEDYPGARIWWSERSR